MWIQKAVLATAAIHCELDVALQPCDLSTLQEKVEKDSTL